METVTVARRIDAPPADVEAAIRDLEPFMRAGEFDEVTVDGDEVHLENAVGLATLTLDLEVVEDPEVTLAYVQRDGIFEEMTTTVDVEPVDGASEVTARTEFAMRGGPLGSLLDATVIQRQRRKEMESQMDYLAETASVAAE